MQNDHDLLIRLDTQLATVLTELKDIKLQMTTKITEIDTRVTSLERISITGNVEARLQTLERIKEIADKINVKEYQNMLAWAERYRANYKYIIGTVATAGLIMGGILEGLVNFFRLFGHSG